ncbi:MAG: hypothetical protein ACYTG5_01360 [Planctomycetota bacterium]|jgi:hypothetical protein
MISESRIWLIPFWVGSLLLLCACDGRPDIGFGPFHSLGRVPTDLKPEGSLAEISGLAVSRRHPDLIWVHDDSGGGANLVALRGDGSFVQNYRLRGADADDWEDIALGPGPNKKQDYLYLADSGNNEGERKKFTLLRILEPSPPDEPRKRIRLKNVDEFPYRYPVQAPDAETLLIDPVDGSPYILSKDRKGPTKVFRYPLPMDDSKRKTLEFVTVIQSRGVQFTGGDVSPDGSQIFLRSDLGIHLYARAPGTELWIALTRETGFMPVIDQGQGEALAVSADNESLFTISEGSGAIIWRSARQER